MLLFTDERASNGAHHSACCQDLQTAGETEHVVQGACELLRPLRPALDSVLSFPQSWGIHCTQ